MIVMELVPGGSLLNYLRTSADKLATKALLGNGSHKKYSIFTVRLTVRGGRGVSFLVPCQKQM